MKLTALGTGSAFEGMCHNASHMLNDELLVDAGAPVPYLLRRLPNLEAPKYILITHFHGDHTGNLPVILGHIASTERDGPTKVIGPVGIREFTERLVCTVYGNRFWLRMVDECRLEFLEVDDATTVTFGRWTCRGVALFHSLGPSIGYHLACRHDAVTLGITGDTALCAGLSTLASLSDVLLTECSFLHPPALFGHLSTADVAELVHDNPATRILLAHYGAMPHVKGALTLHDGMTLKLTEQFLSRR